MAKYTQFQFSKADVDYILDLPKFIKCIPPITHLDLKLKTGWMLQSEVHNRAESNRHIRGLIIAAKAHQAPSGLPPPNPSVALMWHSSRIRGLNHEQWHDNPDGSIVRGWHEHIWSPMEGDARVVPARPDVTKKTLLDVFRWGLKKWKIAVMIEQGTFDDD